MHAPSNSTGNAARLFIAAATAGALLAGASVASAAPPRSAPVTPVYGADQRTAANKTLVVHFFDQLFNHGDLAVVDRYVEPDYTQHNPTLADGAKALRDWVTGLKAAYPESHVTIKHVIAQGDLVILHSNFVLEPGTKGTAAFDIFRLEKGKIAEHWDILQPVPDSTADGNDMFSTLSTPRLPGPDPHVSAAVTKRVGLALFEGLTIDHDLTAYDRYVAAFAEEHTPGIANGTAAAKEYLAGLFAKSPDLSAGVKRVVVEGDYVAIHSHYKTTADDRGMARLDLFRVRSGKVVEHWDVAQPVPETSANDNTMF